MKQLYSVMFFMFSLLLPLTVTATEMERGVTITYLSSDDNRADAEAVLSADLVITQPMGAGYWTVYLEGSTQLSDDGVNSLIAEANGDAGSALDGDGHGRVQLSELHYSWPLANGNMTLGMLDTSAFLDGSDVANDETVQFLGAFLVNNPTIEFPDYTLGLAWTREAHNNWPGISLVLASSHGLADNPSADYHDLFNVGDDHKGLFAAGELQWPLQALIVRTGLWLSTADHSELSGTDTDANNAGIYASIDGPVAAGYWNIRLGWSDEDVSAGDAFAAAALEYPLLGLTTGVGIAWLQASDELGPGTDDTVQAEIYGRYDFNEHANISGHIQHVSNTGFDRTGAVIDDDVLVYGVRTTITF
jgi:hypothetical protein